ncbi:MAG: type II/IV secretion system protein [Candidatus Pacebacteria bacterium]|nr:type II/IV secretion system protein [Candidatus Paceibacterota bacterium]MBP9772248.1 type II/IV secretion system protein [Candidatus Paceibacterota bacterium]QQR76905.1 MAG: type II/IV secretion system protein [Candidatus Nomurabacteria bacterium]
MIQFDEDKQNKRLEDLKYQEEEDLVRILSAAKYNIPYIDLSTTTIENEALRIVPEKTARAVEIAPFKVLGKNLHIAVRSPVRDDLSQVIEDIKSQNYNPILYMASLASLEKAWSRYGEISFASVSRTGGLDISAEALLDIANKVHNIDDVAKTVEDASTDNKTHKLSHMLEIILGGAIAIKASDIHIEPGEQNVQVRFRLDGVLQNILTFPHETYKLVNSRIKLISGLKLVIKSVAQDGRFSIFQSDGTEISMRVSIIPGAYGESIVMRILDPKSIQVKLDELGIPKKLLSLMENEIAKPNGLILITGPTGSGKTTTLYAFLRKIYSPEIKVITIEDPIEYHLAGITQTQVEKNYTFLEGLRSALRQDPDVIMVGEIRDSETAKIAVESALTGHLVFSTLHTNNAGGVIPRLIDLEVNPKILVSALRLSIAQRLVRKLCQNCKAEDVLSPEDEVLIRKILTGINTEGKKVEEFSIDPNQPLKIWKAVGCDKCNKTGYKGRMGIYEAIQTDESIEKIIPENPSEREIKRVAHAQGTLDMKEDGIIKVLTGITSLSEVKSVVELDEE